MNQIPKKILILEDERPLVAALELKLKHEGFDAVSLLNGEGAIEILEKDNFSLVICDLMMPKVDGFQLLQAMNDKHIDVPVIILTNLSKADDEKKARDLGAKEFFIKADTPLSKLISYIKDHA